MRKVFWKKLFKHSFCLKWNLHERSTYVSTPKPCVSNIVERKLISLEIGGTHKNVNIVFNPKTLNCLIELFFFKYPWKLWTIWCAEFKLFLHLHKSKKFYTCNFSRSFKENVRDYWDVKKQILPQVTRKATSHFFRLFREKKKSRLLAITHGNLQ